jgi:hypothetical protein
MVDNSGRNQGRLADDEKKVINIPDTSQIGQRGDSSSQDMGQGGYGLGMSQQGMESSGLGKDVGSTNISGQFSGQSGKDNNNNNSNKRGSTGYGKKLG